MVEARTYEARDGGAGSAGTAPSSPEPPEQTYEPPTAAAISEINAKLDLLLGAQGISYTGSEDS